MPRRIKKRWIEERLKQLRLQKKDLAKAAGMEPSRFSETIGGTRRLQMSEAAGMAGALKASLPEIYDVFGLNAPNKGYGKLTISAYIDATTGTVIARSEMAGEALEEVDAPFPGYQGSVARIKGESMSPRYREGEIVGFTPGGDHDIRHLLNEEVVTELEDGRMLLKRLHKGDSPNLYTLSSINPNDPPIVNVAIKWAARIDFHIPRKG